MLSKMITIFLLIAVMAATLVLPALAVSDIDEHRSCAQCGMDRKAFGYSRMLLLYEDGAKTGVCSLSCVVTELNTQKNRKVKSLLVADRDSLQLINADKAVWVIGGNKRGVMTRNPKWAFAAEAPAKKFVKENGGKIVSWDAALAAAMEEAAPKK